MVRRWRFSARRSDYPRTDSTGTRREVDVETDHAIVELTTGKGGKARQYDKQLNDSSMNPRRKPVVILAPNWGAAATKLAQSHGIIVVRTQANLVAKLHALGD